VNITLTGSAYAPERACRGRIFPRPIRDLRTSLAQFRRAAMLAGALVLVAPLAAPAQNHAVLPRITSQIDENRLMTLSGNMHPLARLRNDQGMADPSLKMERMTILFRQTAAQRDDLEALLAAQQNPTSTWFHQWLTPQQYGDRFGVAPSDLDQITSWLQAQGFVVVESPASRTFVVFDGTAAQVQTALHLEMHNYATSDAKFYANSGEPSVPAALAGVVAGFRGLNTYQMKPRAIQKKPLSGIPQPNFTSATSGNHFLAPGDFATIYDLNPLYSASTAIDGTGQTIVVIGQSNIVMSDIAAFRAASGLPAKAPILTLVPTSTDPGVLSGTGDEQESSLDIEWAGAVAKNATIRFVYSGNGVGDALQYAVSQNFAAIISVSYGSCEALSPPSEVDALVAIAQQANSQGITIVASVGDGGATACDGSFDNYPAILGLNVDIPGSLPYVTGVGGTEFNEESGTYGQSASGVDVVTSALSYIPEKVWNDSSSVIGLFAGGGGASSVFGKPTWQTGTGVPNDGARDVPDISLNASPAHDPYMVCVQFIPTGSSTFTSSCLNGTFRYSDHSLVAYGGTSFGAPTFAGILALVNQKTSSTGQGNINYILYPLAASSSTAFHDITTGDNTSTCVVGTQDCTTAGYVGFFAGTGYDQATGLGTIDATNLVNGWSSISTGVGSTPTLSSISPTTIAAGSADFTLTATGSSFATNAQILWNGSTSGVTMQPGGTATSITATISHNLVAYGTAASVTVTDDAAKAGESSASQAFTVSGTPPGNDNIANAIPIATINSASTVDNSAATTESTDPTPPCTLTAPVPSTNPRTKTVWWSLTSATNQSIIVSTIGSVYDTTLSVWTGTPGNLTNVACNDDVSVGRYTQSLLSFSATAGMNYYIMVAPFGPPDTLVNQEGGKTVLNVSYGSLSTINATPFSRTVSAGSSATFTITDLGSASDALTCSGLPKGVACGPVTVLAGSTAPLVITTTSRAAVVPPTITKKLLRIDLRPGILVVLEISFFILWTMRKRRVLGLVPVGTLALLLLLLAAGCGSSGNSGGGGTTNPNGTPAGRYTITVTGTSGSTTQSTTVTLVVT
jgi:hypothetical protein